MTNAERQRAYRARRNAVGVTGVTPTVTERDAATVTALRDRVTELEEEVGRLKLELAAANAKIRVVEGMTVPALSAPVLSVEAVRRIEAGYRSPIKPSAARPDNDKQVTPHGPRCACIGCRRGA